MKRLLTVLACAITLASCNKDNDPASGFEIGTPKLTWNMRLNKLVETGVLKKVSPKEPDNQRSLYVGQWLHDGMLLGTETHFNEGKYTDAPLFNMYVYLLADSAAGFTSKGDTLKVGSAKAYEAVATYFESRYGLADSMSTDPTFPIYKWTENDFDLTLFPQQLFQTDLYPDPHFIPAYLYYQSHDYNILLKRAIAKNAANLGANGHFEISLLPPIVIQAWNGATIHFPISVFKRLNVGEDRGIKAAKIRFTYKDDFGSEVCSFTYDFTWNAGINPGEHIPTGKKFQGKEVLFTTKKGMLGADLQRVRTHRGNLKGSAKVLAVVFDDGEVLK